MICPRCGSERVNIQVVAEVTTKHRGCLRWCLWILLALCTMGLILIIPLLTNKKVKSKNKTIATCQNCGCTWEVKDTSPRRNWDEIDANQNYNNNYGNNNNGNYNNNYSNNSDNNNGNSSNYDNF